ncbi:unnamed protein product [Malus baccata var. baccata]
MAELLISLASPIVEIATKKLANVATNEFVNIEDEVERLKLSFMEVQDLLKILEGNHQMNSSTPSTLKNLFERLRAASYDIEDLIDCWAAECEWWKMKKQQQQVHKFHLLFGAFKFLFLHRLLSKLREITSRLHVIKEDGKFYRKMIESNPMHSQTHENPRETVSVPYSSVVSREEEKRIIIEQLITAKEASRGNFSCIPIVGMGGVGKTTLAQLVFQDEKVDGYFSFKIWVHVGKDFELKRIFTEILVSLVYSLNLKRTKPIKSLLNMFDEKKSQLQTPVDLNYPIFDKPQTPVDPNSSIFDKLQISFEDACSLELNQLPSPSDLNPLNLPQLKSLHGLYSNYLERFQTRTENTDFTSLSLDQLQTRIRELLARKRFLLVLDDLWNHEALQQLVNVLNVGVNGSKVLVTSRQKNVSSFMDSESLYSLKCLGDDESWSLFKKLALKEDSNLSDSERREFENCGREIVRMCQGLPLAIKQMAGLLRGKDLKEWENVAKSQTWKARAEDDTGVRPALRLSYNHLPSPDYKQCFSLCSLFPKSYLYEKDELVKLWMAEGFIQPPENGVQERIEDIGSRYFKELSDRFFFECSTEDKTKYRMHDLIHDLALSVSSPFCCQVNDMKDFDEKSRHISLLSEQVEKPAIEIANKSKKLRTLLLPVQHLQLRAFGKGEGEIIHSLTYMRVLDLSSSTVVTLPDSIGRLKLLRYLDLSTTEIRKLPDSVCSLLNLETLKLLRCPWIFNLPKNFKALVNLRHLELDEIFWYKALKLPRSMGCLTSLHNLHKFPVSEETGYKLEELKNMVYLRGTLHITKLENAVNAGEANLKGKEMIQKVVYEWSDNDLNFHDEAAAKQVLEDLEPHPRALKELQICHYKGTEFPRWMGLLTNLVSIHLNNCNRSKVLDLGVLPKLEEFRLKNLLELEDWNGTFKSLKKLKIANCPNLKRCVNYSEGLDFLKIKRCESLVSLTINYLVRPKNITLVDNPVLQSWFVRSSHLLGLSSGILILNELIIINCPELHALPNCFNLEKLETGGCNSVIKMLERGSLKQSVQVKELRHLALDTCSADAKTLVGLWPGIISGLWFLTISNISNLIRLPDWGLPKLRALYIRDCKDLEYLSNQENKLFQGFTSLTALSIQNCPELVTLPVEGLPTSLEYLSIGSCARLASFGPADALQNLNSLHDIYIEDCPALQSLPEGGLPTSLLHLSIQHCASLIEQCGKEGSDWPKIKDIPDPEIGRPSTETATSSPSSSSAAWYHLGGSCACVGQASKGKMVAE